MQRRSLGILALCVACGSTSTERPAALTEDQDGVVFAAVPVGDTSDQTTVRISNVGQVPTAALVTALGGQDPEAFLLTDDGCRGTVLAAGASCQIRVAFRPSAERQFAAELQVSSGKAEAHVGLSGFGDTGTRLSLRGSFSFGGVTLGTSARTIVTVSNDGHAASVPLSVSKSGDTASFTVDGDCIDRSLGPGGSCTLEVMFVPQSLGTKTLSIDLSASPSATAHAKFEGYGKRIAIVSVATDGPGQVAVGGGNGACAQPCRVAVEIGGPTQTVTLSASPGYKALFANWAGDCSGTTPTCNLTVDGDRAAIAKFDRAVSVTVYAESVAGGSGIIKAEPGAACNAPCSSTALVPLGSRVRFSVAADSSSQVRWVSGCSGAEVGCELIAATDVAVKAVFNGANYVFVSSLVYPTNLGLAAYDNACNQMAQAAGLPGPYVAWLSTSLASAARRVGSARGFIRVDGQPFADTLGPGAPIYFPPSLTETGTAPNGYPMAMTGTNEVGELIAGYNCSDWTDASNQASLQLGDPYGGPASWTAGSGGGCGGSWLIYCVGTGLQRPLHLEVARGRVAFASSGTVRADGGLAAADSLCNTEARAAGLPGSYKALLAAEGASAASRFNLQGGPWVRRDGVPIVQKAGDLAGRKWIAPLAVNASGAYDFSLTLAWMGATTPGEAGTAESSCRSWTSAEQNLWGYGGRPTSISPYLGFGSWALSCGFGQYRLYCLQE